ncbi:tetratricopeptide repeat protein [Melioribacteraceae bacterium 4301-Me]|uniref:tetratricopeptide repeat protein n=1 Tax=Pyranulibacter aquaticus TaxID=3163344 RepID=UPI0035974CF7
MRNILYILILISVVGCATADVTNEHYDANSYKNNSITVTDSKKIALSKFIDASINEQEGYLERAAKLYQEALSYDSNAAGIFYSLGKVYYKLNKLSNALSSSEKAVKLSPRNTEFLFLLATIYSAAHVPDSAAVYYQKIISIDSANLQSYYGLAEQYEVNKPAQALEIYEKLLKMVGPDWNLLVRIADLNERLGNIDATIKTVEDLLKLDPSNLNLTKMLVSSYIKTKKTKDAIKIINEQLSSFPDDNDLMELKAQAYMTEGNYELACNTYLQIIKNKNIPFEKKFQIGSSFFFAVQQDSTNLKLAKEIFQEINKDTVDWQVNAYLGEIAIREKDDTSAINYFKVAVKLAEWNSQLWSRLGGLLFDKGKYKEAIEQMSVAIDKFPNDFTINLIYGLSLSQDNQYSKAEVYLDRALKIKSNDLMALIAMGFTLNQLKKEDDALIYLNKALAIDPKNLQAISIAALIYESRKMYNISDSLYANALSVDSNNALILNNYAYSLSVRGKDLDKAFEMSKKSLEAEPNNSSYLDTFGWIYFKKGDYLKAKQYIEKSISIDDKSGTVFDHLGDVYFKLGEKDKAIKNWQKALELDPSIENLKEKIDKGSL